MVEAGFEQSEIFAEEAYDPSAYILLVGQSELSEGLPESAELCMIRGGDLSRDQMI